MAPRTIAGMFQAHKKLKTCGVEQPVVVHCAEDGSQYSVRRLTDQELAQESSYGKPQQQNSSSFKKHQTPLLTGVLHALQELKDEEPVKASEETKVVAFQASAGEEDSSEAVKLVTAQEDESPAQVTEGQKVRMELNKSMACAKRNLRVCQEVVQASEEAFPDLKDLLVDPNWLEVLGSEFEKPYMDRLQVFVKREAGGKVPLYPPPAKVFNAFNTCPFDKVKVVLIGQDPYHGPGQAMGLSFSVPEGVKVPSSLVNIYKELKNDLGCRMPVHGNLEKWAYQGVLLLNTVLTVREHQANSHAKKGWEPFTDAAIRAVSSRKTGVVFLLWGNSAQEKIRLINASAHHVLKAAHPSGLSAHRGFFDCRHFSKTNQLLEAAGMLPIDWQL